MSNKENVAYLFMDRTFILFKQYCHVEVIIHPNQIYCWNNAIFKDEPFGVTSKSVEQPKSGIDN